MPYPAIPCRKLRIGSTTCRGKYWVSALWERRFKNISPGAFLLLGVFRETARSAIVINPAEYHWTSKQAEPLNLEVLPVFICVSLAKVISSWRRGWDSNPRCIAASPVFKTGSLNRSDTSPDTRLLYQAHPSSVKKRAASAPSAQQMARENLQSEENEDNPAQDMRPARQMQPESPPQPEPANT